MRVGISFSEEEEAAIRKLARKYDASVLDVIRASVVMAAGGRLVGESFVPPARRGELRRRLGLTQEEVAEFLGVTRGSVAAWETKGASPRLDVSVRYTALLRRALK